MKNVELQLKQEVMQRVYAVYIIKKILRPLVIKFALLSGLVVATSFLVSIPSIFSNAFSSVHDARHEFNFALSAFLHTEVTIKVIFCLILGVVLFLLWDIAKFLIKINTRPLMFWK
jgi:hypothetical protein